MEGEKKTFHFEGTTLSLSLSGPPPHCVGVQTPSHSHIQRHTDPHRENACTHARTHTHTEAGSWWENKDKDTLL